MLHTFILFLSLYVIINLILMIYPIIYKHKELRTNIIVLNLWVALLLATIIGAFITKVNTDFVTSMWCLTGVTFLLEALIKKLSKKPKNKS